MKIPDEWTISMVGEECVIRNDLRMPISIEERKKIEGTYPYYGPTGILGFINEFRVYGKFALIGEDGDHFLKYKTKSQTLLVNDKFNVNNHAHVIGDSKTCLAEWFYVYFQHKNLEKYLTRQGAGRYKLTKQSLSDIPILLPPIEEQKAITAILSTWEEAIEKTERLIGLKEISFQRLLSSRISDKFFKTRKLGKAIQEISQRNQGGISRVLSVTNHSGFVLPENQFERRVASQNLENYKVVCRGQYAYNPSRINVGSIARLDQWDIGVLSPMYVVFKIDETVIHSDFLYYWLQTKETRKRICASTQGSVRESVNFNDFANLTIPLPELNVQQDIICQLSLIEEELNNLKKTKEKIILQKQGLMQKLLTGKWRVNFKEEK